jgi:hypothetical protein
MPGVRAILRRSAEDDYRFASLLLNIVESDAFQQQAVPATGTLSAMATPNEGAPAESAP